MLHDPLSDRAVAVRPIVNGWEAVTLESGRTYFCHPQGQVSTWQKPRVFEPAARHDLTVVLGLSFELKAVSPLDQVIRVPQPDGVEFLEPWQLWRVHLNYFQKFWYNPVTRQFADYNFLDTLSLRYQFFQYFMVGPTFRGLGV